jgi:hypothetical protein
MTDTSDMPRPATPAYWADRKAAFQHIAALQDALFQRNHAPRYLGATLENDGPWVHLAQLQDSARTNPTILQILTAQGRLDLLDA